MKYRVARSSDGSVTIDTAKRGHGLLGDALLNKGTAFTEDERERLGLRGLLPAQATDRKTQVARAFEHIQRKGDNPLEQYIGLAALQDRNETLFHQVVAHHPRELIPIVYTPTVGEAALEFSHIFRRGRGLWITPKHRGQIAEVLDNARNDDVRLIVATDNERILGLGDQGAGGMVIPIGKLALYTTAAGIHPAHTLPISLDVGTDNPQLLADPLYVGWRDSRLRGAAYDEFIEEFVTAVVDRFPDAVLQWEDFKKNNAFTLLDRYRRRLPSFNDDIQGTGAVGLAGIVVASRINDCRLSDHRFVIAGAGAAGVGIARQLRDALEADGMAGRELERAIAMVDSKGLLTRARFDLDAHKAPFAWREIDAKEAGLGVDATLTETVAALRPTVLIGTSGVAGLFDQTIIEHLGTDVGRPTVLAMSNPTTKCEAQAADIVAWSGGRALVATGSPVPPVGHGGSTRHVGQANNVYVFPGVGLAAIATGAGEITDTMFTVAAHALAESVDGDTLAEGRLYPPIEQLRAVTTEVAIAVADHAADDRSTAEAAALVAAHQWNLDYPTLRAID